MAKRLGAAALILTGAGMLALGYASGATGRALASVSAAAVLVGGGFVFMHSTAYQMMRRTARGKPGQRVLIHAAAGGMGTALLQLGRLVDLEMYGTASAPKHQLLF